MQDQTGHLREMEKINDLSDHLKKSWKKVNLSEKDIQRIDDFIDEVDKITSKYDYLNIEARKLAIRICQYTNDERKKSIALTKLEEVIYWAESGISSQLSDI